MIRHLHIVCLDAPSPPDYGGAIDMHYKIKALAKIGVKISLHYFDYNPARNTKGLENDCEAIYSYKRKSLIQALPLSQPFIVASRINSNLTAQLNADDYPILLEGLHCSGIIPFLNNKQRVVVRMHNEEAAYYHHLAKTETTFLKKRYFLQESQLLHRYQKKLDKSLSLACLSINDIAIFKNEYRFANTSFIPCFIPWQTLLIKEGLGDYCLYHGNMTVSENIEAALWLIENVFASTNIPLIIAGKGIPDKLIAYQKQYAHIRCINNPSITEINELVRNAQVNVLPSMNATGVKLKLLNALLNGRYCITNNNGVLGSGLEDFVIVANDKTGWIKLVEDTMKIPFNSEAIEKRHEVLKLYDNEANAKKLSELW